MVKYLAMVRGKPCLELGRKLGRSGLPLGGLSFQVSTGLDLK
jgi:hypothetical protein